MTRIQQVLPGSPEAAQVWQIREEVLRQPLGLSLRNEDLSGEADQLTFAALEGDAVVGCLMLMPIGDRFFKLRQMAVAPAFQGRGIGTLLIGAAEEFAKARRCEKIILHARTTAEGFYQKLDYQTTSSVFAEVGIPHVIMQKFMDEGL